MWAKFGQMTGKVISKIKKPKGIKAKAMSMAQNAKSKVKGYGSKAKEAAKKIKNEASVVKLAGVKNYSKFKMNRIKKFSTEFIKANPKKSIVGAGVAATFAYGQTPMARKNQNTIIEMQKISKERKTRKISSKEIDMRLKKAKQSKREFTWFG